MFDPNTWEDADLVCLLPLQDHAEWPCVQLDAIDYQWAVRWRWFAKPSNGSGGRVRKIYAFRAIRVGGRTNGQPRSLWLHREICLRAYGPPPDLWHTITDHRDGDSLNCRRANLRWATPSMNARNTRRRHEQEK